MFRQLGGALVGFVVWSAGWIASNVFLKKLTLLPSDDTQRIEDGRGLVALLLCSFILSLLAGYISASISRRAPNWTALILGFLLLATGLFFQSQYWQLMPLWYHLSFLGFLIPFCLAGARRAVEGNRAGTRPQNIRNMADRQATIPL